MDTIQIELPPIAYELLLTARKEHIERLTEEVAWLREQLAKDQHCFAWARVVEHLAVKDREVASKDKQIEKLKNELSRVCGELVSRRRSRTCGSKR